MERAKNPLRGKRGRSYAMFGGKNFIISFSTLKGKGEGKGRRRKRRVDEVVTFRLERKGK